MRPRGVGAALLLLLLGVLSPLTASAVKNTADAIRWLILAHTYAGMNIAYIAAACRVSMSTVYRVRRRFRQTGSVERKGRSGRARILSRAELGRLREMVEGDPTGYLDEYAVRLSVELGKTMSVSTIDPYVHRHLRLTRKKVRWVRVRLAAG